jgi:hypothetical protein
VSYNTVLSLANLLMPKYPISFPRSYRRFKLIGRCALWCVFLTALVLAVVQWNGIDVSAHGTLIAGWVALMVVGKTICDELASRALRKAWDAAHEGSDQDSHYAPWTGGARIDTAEKNK